jgi:hypothetical protein
MTRGTFFVTVFRQDDDAFGGTTARPRRRGQHSLLSILALGRSLTGTEGASLPKPMARYMSYVRANHTDDRGDQGQHCIRRRFGFSHQRYDKRDYQRRNSDAYERNCQSRCLFWLFPHSLRAFHCQILDCCISENPALTYGARSIWPPTRVTQLLSRAPADCRARGRVPHALRSTLDKYSSGNQRAPAGLVRLTGYVVMCSVATIIKNDRSIRYSLGRSTAPMAVAAYT